MEITYHSIGTIHSPFQDRKGMPVQPSGAKGIEGRIELNEELLPGLADLSGFSHLLLVYHFHKSEGYQLSVKPFLDDQEHGVFATRAPRRPNSIGISVVELVRIEKNVLHIRNVDILDGTPLLDIKPHVPDFDEAEVSRKGWLDKLASKARDIRSDDRFV